MTMHPHIGIENIRERQREMTAQAERRRLERQLSDMARASRRAEAGRRRQRRAWRTIAGLTRGLPGRWATWTRPTARWARTWRGAGSAQTGRSVSITW
jgi:hypothetical protein